MVFLRYQSLALSLCLWLIGLSLSAQNPGRSLKIVGHSGPTTRAVIIGVSNYQDDKIPDLKYAHVDAQAFADYLLESYMDGIDQASAKMLEDNQVRILLNQKATGGNVTNALNWLENSTRKGDKCIIYFSGHGDVETRNEEESGHFLLYDTPSKTYQINSIRVNDLQEMVNRLTVEKSAEVIVITDACRSGKLAGSAINGSQATAAALLQQYGNEVKIMSCQPDEYSYEGEQWGGGRGMFSYHMINGLRGDADGNQNAEISLKEIHRHLEDRFDEEELSASQTPVIQGNRKAVLGFYEMTEILASAQMDQMIPQAFEAEDDIAQPQDNFTAFYKAIADKNLVAKEDSDDDSQAALDIYQSLEQANPSDARIALAKGDLIAALQDEAQQAINAYLTLDPKEIDRRFDEGADDYFRYADYLTIASDLCGEFHYIYPQLKAKALYFGAVAQRIQYDRDSAEAGEYQNLIPQLEEALRFDSRAPYVLNEMGLNFERANQLTDAIESYNEAIEISPNWGFPYNNIGFAYEKMGDKNSAIRSYKNLIRIIPEFELAYENLYWVYKENGEIDQAISTLRKAIQINPHNCINKNDLGFHHYTEGRLDTALHYVKLATQCNKDYSRAYYNLQNIYQALEQYEEAEKTLIYMLSRFEEHSYYHYQLGKVYFRRNKFELSRKELLRAVEMDEKNPAQSFLIDLSLAERKEQKAKARMKYAKENNLVSSKEIEYYQAVFASFEQDQSKFAYHINNAIQEGFSDIQKYIEQLSHIGHWKAYQQALDKLHK